MKDERFDLRLRDLGVTMRPYVNENTWEAVLTIDVVGASCVTVVFERVPPGEGFEGGQFSLSVPGATFEGEWMADFDAAWNSVLDQLDRWSPPLALEIRRLEWSYQERVKRAELNGESLEDEEEVNL